jgi:fatty acid desaturase
MPSPSSQRVADWPTVLVLLAMYGVLVGNFVVYRTAPFPLVLHILVSAAAIHLAFTVWHESVHWNVSSRAWVNNVVGVAGMLPYMTPYFMQKWIHLEHHARLNQRDDPNVIYADGPFWTLPLRYPRALRYAKTLIDRDPRSPAQRASDVFFLCVVGGVYLAAWWLGALADVVLLWLVPVVVAKVVMDWYINWLPHAGLPADRFLGTRVIDVPWLTPLILAHNYHAIHHLWTRVPWHRYRSVFKEKLDYLRENGVPIEHSVLGLKIRSARVERSQPVSG